MKRQIIQIDQEKCNGCGACAAACQEGAIGMVAGKATLLRDDYCDGLGNCLPACPTGAITFVEREAAAYDEAAVAASRTAQAPAAPHGAGAPAVSGSPANSGTPASAACGTAGPAHIAGCPGHRAQVITHAPAPAALPGEGGASPSQLGQWPVQIKLVPLQAPWFEGANLLVAADCTAYAYGSFHKDFIRGKITLIGCPKLDDVDYTEKLTEILRRNNIKSLTVVRMEVPCCGGLEHAAVTALKNSGKFLPWQVVTISTDGRILE